MTIEEKQLQKNKRVAHENRTESAIRSRQRLPVSIAGVGFWLGLMGFAALLLLPAPDSLSGPAWRVVALAFLMAVWWSAEAIPIPATSLLPVILLPLMGVSTTLDAATPFARPVIFLLLGGFIAAMAMQRWLLHKRIALFILSRVGDHPAALMAGFMGASAFLSMWISNTATALMIIPIALTVAETLSKGGGKSGTSFTVALLIGCAWSASIGGLGTYIGTPPNLFVKDYIETATGREILFTEWMAFAVPVVLVMVPAAWLVLTKIAFPFKADALKGGAAVIGSEKAALGAMTRAEKRVAFILVSMAILWMTRQIIVTSWLVDLLPFLKGLSDTHIALMGGVAMFLVPAGEGAAGGSAMPVRRALLTWEEAVKLPWGVLLLFGGGLSLAGAIQATGLADFLGSALSGIGEAPLFVAVLAVVVVVIFLTELTSNTATTAALVPVVATIAVGGDINPILLAAPVAMAASCAFMLPVATGPNAVVFSTGKLTVSHMARAGFYLNIIGSFLVAGVCYSLLPWVFGL